MSEAIEKVVREPYKLPDDLECPTELLGDDWKLGIDRLSRVVLKMAMLDPRFYPCGKLARDWMLGRGELLRSGQVPTSPIGTQNNFFLCIKSEKDVQRLIELGAKAFQEGTFDGAIALVEGTNSGPDQERPALVAAELHSDI